MHNKLEAVLDSLVLKGHEHHFKNLYRGLEKESLRVTPFGLLAQTPHPFALGSALTHPCITTDYSESLLEFVTGIHQDIGTLLQELYDIHHFTYQHIGNEKLWVNSMPCIVQSEEKIPVAHYGTSNIAKMKEVYRIGLYNRYGPLMQTIAGIHFNFSLSESYWTAAFESSGYADVQSCKSAGYFSLIRNFHRHSWLGTYLFGASPAVCQSFLQGRKHSLENLQTHSFFAPKATSLRLSSLGYSNEVQKNIDICYNNADEFVQSLRKAIQSPHPAYQKIGVNVNGQYHQLNANLLQIENEFYSSIRPKRVTKSGHSPYRTLSQAGVEYVEVRSIDLNPFEPIGIHEDCIRFFDMFLIYCLLLESPPISKREFQQSWGNQQTIVMDGRNIKAEIITDKGRINARQQIKSRLTDMIPIADLLDRLNGGNNYLATLNKQFEKANDDMLTPSARILTHLHDNRQSFYEFAMEAAENSEQVFKQVPMSKEVIKKYELMSNQSHTRRAEIESSDKISFDAFLTDYFKRQNAPL